MTSVMGSFYIIEHSNIIFSIFGRRGSWFFNLFVLVTFNEYLIGTHWAFQKYDMFIVLHFIKISINTLWKNEGSIHIHVKPIHWWGTFSKCRPKFGYLLILGPFYWEFPTLGLYPTQFIVG
jgi:hypothetical protein